MARKEDTWAKDKAKKLIMKWANDPNEPHSEQSVFETLDTEDGDMPDFINTLSPEGNSLLMCVIANTQEANREQQLKNLLTYEKCDINQANNKKKTVHCSLHVGLRTQTPLHSC